MASRQQQSGTAFRRCVAAVLLSLLGISGCQTTDATLPLTDIAIPFPNLNLPRIPLPNLNLPVLLRTRGDGDFSRMNWPEAFTATNAILAIEYPYTEHKQIDWSANYNDFGPRLEKAYADNSKFGIYSLLREYAWSLHDRSVSLTDVPAYRDAAIGGSYGLVLVELRDGRFFVRGVISGSPAERAGIARGAVLDTWNGRPMAEQVASAKGFWDDRPAATLEAQRRSQVRIATRAPVGTQAEIGYTDADGVAKRVTLLAVDDDYLSLTAYTPEASFFEELDSPVEVRTLAGGIGYIKVHVFGPTMFTPFPADAFNREVVNFAKAGAPGLVVDLRGNPGGDLALVPVFLQHFYRQSAVLADAQYFNPDTGTFGIAPAERLNVAAQLPTYTGKVVLLVDEQTAAAAEVFAWAMRKVPDTRIAGRRRTAGNLAGQTRDIKLPEGWYLTYPRGRLVDTEGRIIVEAGALGDGGIAPDWQFELTAEAARGTYVRGDDWLLGEVNNALVNEAATR